MQENGLQRELDRMKQRLARQSAGAKMAAGRPLSGMVIAKNLQHWTLLIHPAAKVTGICPLKVPMACSHLANATAYFWRAIIAQRQPRPGLVIHH